MDPQERISTLITTKASSMKERATSDEMSSGAQFDVAAEELEALLADWPAAPKKVAEQMIGQYGPPNEATPVRLIWHHNGEWKRTMVTKDEGHHNFPTPHTDYITQTINYRVPPEKFTELALFDGSVLLNRTSGEASASCDAEPLNILALNLMHEIVQGKVNAEDARKMYSDQAAAWSMNRSAPYTERLLFEVASADETRDPDLPTLAPDAMKHTAGKVKDVVFGEGPQE